MIDAFSCLVSDMTSAFGSEAPGSDSGSARLDIRRWARRLISEADLMTNFRSNTLLADVLIEKNVVASKTEWRRLVESGAVYFVDGDQKISDPFQKVQTGAYKIGKRRFIKINLK